MSERGYSRWLGRLGGRYGVPVAITAHELNGGDPLDLVERTVEALQKRERHTAGFPVRGLFLDSDQLQKNQDRDSQAISLAEEHDLILVWQRPNHEGFLLAHLAGAQPENAEEAARKLVQAWPGYKKGMDALGYEGQLSVENLEQGRAAIPELDNLLKKMGWRIPGARN